MGRNGTISLKSDILRIAFSQEPYSRVWRTEWREAVAGGKHRSGKKFSASERKFRKEKSSKGKSCQCSNRYKLTDILWTHYKAFLLEKELLMRTKMKQ